MGEGTKGKRSIKDSCWESKRDSVTVWKVGFDLDGLSAADDGGGGWGGGESKTGARYMLLEAEKQSPHTF